MKQISKDAISISRRFKDSKIDLFVLNVVLSSRKHNSGKTIERKHLFKFTIQQYMQAMVFFGYTIINIEANVNNNDNL